MIGKVAKLDFNTDSRMRGRYARMEVNVNLGKPLTSMFLINSYLQRIEYENLPLVCFSCGWYGHNKESCPNIAHITESVKEAKSMVATSEATVAGDGDYYP
ncbi:hypothetical protein PVK06_019663 [Gossypium arboreum]|uniref:CCHC-type domain-containing protein n=1 Tax=Gossypium arboreum TaxID=29729 RepID=A0ABR0PKF2_GOSAR|nr:hypothetical protein PVK06_019663 [Gossypium arboreum]